MISVPLDSPVTVPTERTLKLIFKILTLNTQQFVREIDSEKSNLSNDMLFKNVLHRKQHLIATFEPCLQLCDAFVTL